jgi:DNA-binding NarL/FixJ family response regulator
MWEPDNEIITVLVVQEHAVVCEGLRMLIDAWPKMHVVGVARVQSEAVLLAKRKAPDVILLDMDFDREEAFDTLQKLRQAAKRSRILLLASKGRTTECGKAVRLGAMGVVLNKDGPALLEKAIERVHQGEVWVDRSMMGSLLHEISHGPGLDSEAAKIMSLTEGERKVITLVGEGLKNKQIAKRLFVSETTVSHRLSSIFSKLEVSDRLELVIYAFSNGLADIPQRKIRLVNE